MNLYIAARELKKLGFIVTETDDELVGGTYVMEDGILADEFWISWVGNEGGWMSVVNDEREVHHDRLQDAVYRVTRKLRPRLTN